MTTEVAPPPPAAPMPPTPDYPIKLSIGRPSRSSRLLLAPLGIGHFIRSLLLIPHLIVLFFLGVLFLVVYLIATVAILFSGSFPRGMYEFIVGVSRWNANVQAYMYGLIDTHPPFKTEQTDFPVIYQAEYPEKSSRILNFPVLGLYLKELLLIPHLVVLFFLGIAVWVVLVIAPFAVLFTGQFPEGLHRFLVGVSRWTARLGGYLIGLTDRYPPFSMQ